MRCPPFMQAYAAFLSIRRPSFFMLIAAFWSRSMISPQSQRIFRMERSFISGCICPQQWHSWLEGYHLSTLIRYFPRSDSLYSSMFRNIPYPLSRVAFPFPKPLFAIAFKFRSSTQTTSYRLAIPVDILCKVSFRWFAIWCWIRFTFLSCFM